MLDRKTATWAERKEEKERIDDLFRRNKIGHPTYILSLEILGFRNREANDEANYVETNRR